MFDILILLLIIILLPSVIWTLFVLAVFVIGTVVSIFDMGSKK